MTSTKTSVGRRVALVSVGLVAAVVLSACTSSAPAETATSTPAPSSSASATVSPSPSPTPAGPTEVVVAAATEFLARLTAEQRDRVMYDAADPALQQWSYFPSTNDRNGVALGELSEDQRAHALGVAEAMLSASGYEQVLGVLAAEDALGVRNGEEGTVNAGRIFIAFFGEPHVSERFTVQINGHHLAVNTTYQGGLVSPTPAFTGVDPVDFEVDGRRLRPMLAESEAVSTLLTSLQGDANAAAAGIGPVDDVRVGTGASTTYPEPAGVLVTDLDPGQQELVVAVMRGWVGDIDERVAEALLQQYQAEFDRTRVAWSGSVDANTPGSYLRIDGPRLWIEFSNVGRFGNGDNHYHSVYRDRQADYLR